MFTSFPWARPFVGAGFYVASLILLSLAAAWGATTVGVSVIRLLDRKILDGSGVALPEPDWTPPPVVEGSPFAGSEKQSTGATPTSGLAPPMTPLRASTDDPVRDPAADFHNGASETYRTYCVRLCDGYYWPVNFSTTPDHFNADAETCNASCNSPARLFVHRVPGGGPGTMVSLEGLPYRALKTAFLFRTRYDAQCKCQPQPWEQAAKNRHQYFAAVAAARKGSPVAAATARSLAQKIEDDRRTEAAAKVAAESQARRELASLARKNGPNSLSGPLARRYADAIGEASFFGTDAAPTDTRKGRFIPSSGGGRAWKDRAFGDH